MGNRLPHGLGRCNHLGECYGETSRESTVGDLVEAAEIEDVFLGFVPATQVSITGRSCRIKMAMKAKPLRELVDLVGIEPTTSSMPWNWKICKLLTSQGQKIG
jgi:hypothetical protein